MNETVKVILERSSARKYRNEHVSKEDLELIVQAGLKAPSGGNKQTPRFVIITNKAVRDRLMVMNAQVAGAPEGFDVFYGAQDVIAVVAKKEGDWVCDGSLAMGNMLNAAYAMGLGARWINRARQVFDTEEGKKILADAGLTEDVEGIGFCIVGVPDEELSPKPIVQGRVYYIE